MSIQAKKFVSFHLSTQDQKAEHIKSAIEQMLKMTGCSACGMIAHLRIDIGDPVDGNIAKLGVTGMMHG